MDERYAKCANCGTPIEQDISDVEREPCPKCGSISREIYVALADAVVFHEKLRTKLKAPKPTGGMKIKVESVSGDDLHRDSGKWNKRVQLFDHENDWYKELIIDSETGKVLHQCEEPLSKHTGHGSDKKHQKADGANGGEAMPHP